MSDAGMTPLAAKASQFVGQVGGLPIWVVGLLSASGVGTYWETTTSVKRQEQAIERLETKFDSMAKVVEEIQRERAETRLARANEHNERLIQVLERLAPPE